jgi:hypothetical protein
VAHIADGGGGAAAPADAAWSPHLAPEVAWITAAGDISLADVSRAPSLPAAAAIGAAAAGPRARIAFGAHPRIVYTGSPRSGLLRRADLRAPGPAAVVADTAAPILNLGRRDNAYFGFGCVLSFEV